MKKIKLLLAITSFVFSLSSCAEVPQEVKEDMQHYRTEQEQSEKEFSFELIPVSELSDNADKALKEKNYGQFELSDKIDFSCSQEIYSMSFSFVNDFQSEFDKCIELLYEGNAFNNGYTTESDGDSEYVMLSDDNAKEYFYVSSEGFLAKLNPDVYELSFEYGNPRVKIYHAQRKDDLSDKYELDDKIISVQEAVDYINNWLDTEYEQTYSAFDYRVETVIVRENNGKNLFQIHCNAYYKGVALDSFTRESDNDYTQCKMNNMDYAIDIQMLKSNEISSFTNGGTQLIPEENERISECIPLESALKFCEYKFADFNEMTISDVNHMYTLEPEYETKITDDGQEYEVMTKYNSHPVWEIVIDVNPSEYASKGEADNLGDMRKYIYIDMVTGGLKYKFDNLTYRR